MRPGSPFFKNWPDVTKRPPCLCTTPRMQCQASFRGQSELHVDSFRHRARGSIVEPWASARAVNPLVKTEGAVGGLASSRTPRESLGACVRLDCGIVRKVCERGFDSSRFHLHESRQGRRS